ncbi:sensor histidine kinase [Altibacter sp. HG106]|uniref:sensor histidine kinase n=1 Tax=Altibacter sp. HG106 TaxID=3023937 RepID=UPI002350CB47|nr:histidine kinase [Altibacter sp. HG106]MDC7993802.1 histidine kinase [Altibacter sp. HG106]
MNATSVLSKKSIRASEVMAVLGFYLLFSALYNVVLWYNGQGFKENIFGFLDLEAFWYRSGMQYVFFFFSSLLIWFLGIYLLRKKEKSVQILVVILITPLIIYLTREVRYAFVDYLGKGRLVGTGEVWDWYIPLLFFYIQFGCFFAYRYFLENQRKLRLEGELRQAALKSELSAIKAQLNPHFLYNVFNTINASVPAENEKTRHLIAQLSDLFRYQLQASQQEVVTLEEELNFVRKYLELEKERFGDRLHVNIDVPQSIYQEKIPPMLLQPLVENSVKHGLASLIEGGTINITIFKEKDSLKFEISDTGIGAENPQALFDKGVGLSNTRLRLQKMYASNLKILQNKPSGLIIQFSI